VVENYGDSQLAKRFGVKRYPAIFVDDVLVATPKDFGFFGKGEGKDEGRYAPLKSAASHERLRADLARMLQLVLAGDTASARAQAASPVDAPVPALPALALTDLEGRPVTAEDLAGKAVLVEFWATWCPPCRGTLAWLSELQRRHAGKLVVLAAAIESDEADVRRIRDELGLELRVAMGTPEMARAFGDLSALPTLFVFDRQGRTLGSFFGAPPELHAEVEQALAGQVLN
jgi:cytochrome c biogenesis protein CcmG, thiol:disulfide interchange protein DsbE